MSPINAGLLFILIMALTLAIQEVTGNPWVKYALTDTGISVMVFGFGRLKDIPYSAIVEIRKATAWEGFLGWLIFLSRDRLRKTPVAIIWRYGGMNKYVMSPDDADAFIAEVQRRMAASKASGVSRDSHD
jgi:hypothetical protein